MFLAHIYLWLTITGPYGSSNFLLLLVWSFTCFKTFSLLEAYQPVVYAIFVIDSLATHTPHMDYIFLRHPNCVQSTCLFLNCSFSWLSASAQFFLRGEQRIRSLFGFCPVVHAHIFTSHSSPRKLLRETAVFILLRLPFPLTLYGECLLFVITFILPNTLWRLWFFLGSMNLWHRFHPTSFFLSKPFFVLFIHAHDCTHIHWRPFTHLFISLFIPIACYLIFDLLCFSSVFLRTTSVLSHSHLSYLGLFVIYANTG